MLIHQREEVVHYSYGPNADFSSKLKHHLEEVIDSHPYTVVTLYVPRSVSDHHQG